MAPEIGITLQICSFHPMFLSVLVGAVYRAVLKKCGIPRTEGPLSLPTPWAKSQILLPTSSSESGEAVRAEAWHWATGDQPNLNPDPQTTAGVLRPPSLRTHGWHLLCGGIHCSLSDLIIHMFVDKWVRVYSLGSPFLQRGANFLLQASLFVEKSRLQRPFWPELCHR